MGNCRFFNLTLLSGNIMEHTSLESIFKDKKIKKVIRNIHLGFTNLTAFYDKITVSVDDTDFSMAFDTVSHRTLLWKRRECGLDKWTVTWVENQLHDQSQTLVIKGLTSGWQTVMGRVL